MSSDPRELDDRKGWSGGAIVFLALLAAGWLWIVYTTIIATQRLGLAAAMTTFSNDMAHPWRAQYYGDFLLHVALVAAWILYRTRSWIAGILLAALCVNGSLYTFPYIFVATVRARGDLRRVLLGWRYRRD